MSGQVSLRSVRVVTLPFRLAASADRHPGTNGYLSSWGTNGHGELAGCPPSGS